MVVRYMVPKYPLTPAYPYLLLPTRAVETTLGHAPSLFFCETSSDTDALPCCSSMSVSRKFPVWCLLIVILLWLCFYLVLIPVFCLSITVWSMGVVLGCLLTDTHAVLLFTLFLEGGLPTVGVSCVPVLGWRDFGYI